MELICIDCLYFIKNEDSKNVFSYSNVLNSSDQLENIQEVIKHENQGMKETRSRSKAFANQEKKLPQK